MTNNKHITIVILATLAAFSAAAEANPREDLSKAWRWDLRGFSLDPTIWTNEWKTKMTYVGTICAYMMTLQFPLAQIAAFGLFCVGLTKLNWALVGALCATIYGYKNNKKLFLGLGAIASYCLAFGYQLV